MSNPHSDVPYRVQAALVDLDPEYVSAVRVPNEGWILWTCWPSPAAMWEALTTPPRVYVGGPVAQR